MFESLKRIDPWLRMIFLTTPLAHFSFSPRFQWQTLCHGVTPANSIVFILRFLYLSDLSIQDVGLFMTSQLARRIPIFPAIHDKIVFVIAAEQSKTLGAETTFEVDSR
jgi:hypothetical protein